VHPEAGGSSAGIGSAAPPSAATAAVRPLVLLLEVPWEPRLPTVELLALTNPPSCLPRWCFNRNNDAAAPAAATSDDASRRGCLEVTEVHTVPSSCRHRVAWALLSKKHFPPFFLLLLAVAFSVDDTGRHETATTKIRAAENRVPI